MAGGRKQAGARVPTEGGPAKPGVKGKNFNRAEEEQLCISVFFVSQDRIVGNQQKAGVFWERIADHYEDHRPDAPRPQRSLETKWELIKHDVSSFCGVYSQVLRLNKSGTSAADTLRHARELYRQKSPKKQEFAFEHCWLLLKDHPKWSDGWSSPKASSSMRSGAASARSPTEAADAGRSRSEFHGERSPVGHSQSEGAGLGWQRTQIARPGGSKAAREESRSNSAREGAIYAQADATRTMAAAQMKKAALLEDQNMLLLMTMPDDKITTAEAREYLRLRRGDELKKLRRKLAEEEDRERQDAARADTEQGRYSATKRRRQAQGFDDEDEGEGSQQRCRGFDRSGEVCAKGMGAAPSSDGHQEGTASQPDEDDEGEGEHCVSLSEGGRDGCCVGEEGKQVPAGDEAFGKHGFGSHGASPNEEIAGCETNQGSGMWTRPQCARQTVAGVTTDVATSFNRNWLDNDCVEHGQCNVDVGLTLQGKFY